MLFFKCKHPAAALAVEKGSTKVNHDEDFDHITHHLVCKNCGELIDIKYADMIGGVDAFLERGRGVNE